MENDGKINQSVTKNFKNLEFCSVKTQETRQRWLCIWVPLVWWVIALAVASL